MLETVPEEQHNIKKKMKDMVLLAHMSKTHTKMKKGSISYATNLGMLMKILDQIFPGDLNIGEKYTVINENIFVNQFILEMEDKKQKN